MLKISFIKKNKIKNCPNNLHYSCLHVKSGTRIFLRKITEKISWLQSRANDTRILWEKYFFRNDIDKTSSPMFLLKPLVPVSKNKSFAEFPDHNMVSMLKSRCPIVFDNIWKIQSVFALREIIFLVSMKITSKNYPLK